MAFIITMAGLSSRFRAAGYEVPKYELPLKGTSMFCEAVSSFKRYFETDRFIFVVRSGDKARHFVESQAQTLGIADYSVFELDCDSRGQAETLYLALQHELEDFPIFVFNIDTIRYNYEKPSFVNECDGYLEVFKGEGSGWSFVRPGEHNIVLETTEKERISELCSNGLYYFRSHKQFSEIFMHATMRNELVKGEFYIAPLYNKLINAGKFIRYFEVSIDALDFCGTPSEYSLLLKKVGK
jgi:dTDP-glucose pyrophosphorylase